MSSAVGIQLNITRNVFADELFLQFSWDFLHNGGGAADLFLSFFLLVATNVPFSLSFYFFYRQFFHFTLDGF